MLVLLYGFLANVPLNPQVITQYQFDICHFSNRETSGNLIFLVKLNFRACNYQLTMHKPYPNFEYAMRIYSFSNYDLDAVNLLAP